MTIIVKKLFKNRTNNETATIQYLQFLETILTFSEEKRTYIYRNMTYDFVANAKQKKIFINSKFQIYAKVTFF